MAVGFGSRLGGILLFLTLLPIASNAQEIHLSRACPAGEHRLLLAGNGKVLPIYVAPQEPELLRLAANAFAGDMERVTGVRPRLVDSLEGVGEAIIVGTVAHSPAIAELEAAGKLDLSPIRGKWESSATSALDRPTAALEHVLVIAGSDRRGAAFALFTLSRQMGVSPWTWWADVPVTRADRLCMEFGASVQAGPSVPYRGVFLNDEDWGLRPWAAKKMDPELHNIGPHTYRQVFELLLRLRANTLWPAMHPGTLAFNAIPENPRLADQWGIVMGSSHSEAMLRNNVGEWDEQRDGPWNYQTNRQAIDNYWKQRLLENGKYENFYTVGMRGLHDSGLEATGTSQDKARLVEQVISSQRQMLAADVNLQVERIPQVLWLYKESLDLYRAGMRVPDDVTLGWTDDNYGYLRQLPSEAEQKRAGGSAVYYHVSYWGFPHDYLWLCTTPPALIREEMRKAWDHGARRLWILNVGDLKPAELDIDYFLQFAWDEPRTAQESQADFLKQWFAEQFGASIAPQLTAIENEYYRLNFIRKPEYMGFNGYDDETRRSEFNPLAWGDQNRERIAAWRNLSDQVDALSSSIPAEFKAAYYELIAYPVQAAAAQNEKFLFADHTYVDAYLHRPDLVLEDHRQSRAAYARIQDLTRDYNQLEGGKWDGMMDSAPRARQVFYIPITSLDSSGSHSLPPFWNAPPVHTVAASCSNLNLMKPEFHEENATVSINAAHFARRRETSGGTWRVLEDLGISGSSMVFGSPGATSLIANYGHLEDAAWLEYDFDTASQEDATLTVHSLPVFPIDSEHRLRFAVELDGGPPQNLDLSGTGEWKEGSAPTWETNVLRNDARLDLSLGKLRPGSHTLRLVYIDPGVVFQHLTITFKAAPSAYPVPPETRCE